MIASSCDHEHAGTDDVPLTAGCGHAKDHDIIAFGFFRAFSDDCYSSVVSSKPEYTKKENTPCASCHTRAGARELNDVCKCYAEKHSL
jgi:hypothetical protein